MRLAVMLFSVLFLSCGPERKASIEDRGGSGPNDNDPRRKLQASQNDSRLMTTMVMSRFGEVDRVLRTLINFADSKGNCPSLELGPFNDEGQAPAVVSWEECPGSFGVIAEVTGTIDVDSAGEFLSAEMSELSASPEPVYRNTKNGSYYVIGRQTMKVNPTDQTGVFSFVNEFMLKRKSTQQKRNWQVVSHQRIRGYFSSTQNESDPDRPSRYNNYSNVSMDSRIEQHSIDNDKKVFSESRFDLADLFVSEVICGFLQGSYSMRFRTDRLDNPLEPKKMLVVGSSSFTDPFGAVYRYDNCRAENNNLLFVKTNLESLSQYKVRD